MKSNFSNGIRELYTFISEQNNFSIDKIIEIIFNSNFKLQLNEKLQEVRLTEQEFQDYHSHCFETPLLAICHIASQHNTDITDQQLKQIIKHLVYLHADVNAVDEDGNTAILLLASSVPNRNHLTESIQLLINEGADINAINNEGKNILHRTFEMMNFSLALYFYYDFGAKVIEDVRKSTFLAECQEHDIDELNKLNTILIQNLIAHYLVNTKISQSNDYLYHALINDKNGLAAIKMCNLS